MNIDEMVDAALFSSAIDEDGEPLAMLIDFMGMGVPEKLSLARVVMHAAICTAMSQDSVTTDDLVRKAWIAFDGQWFSDRDQPESMQRMRRVIEVLDAARRENKP